MKDKQTAQGPLLTNEQHKYLRVKLSKLHWCRIQYNTSPEPARVLAARKLIKKHEDMQHRADTKLLQRHDQLYRAALDALHFGTAARAIAAVEKLSKWVAQNKKR